MKRIIISLLVVLLTFSAISGYSEATDPGQEIFEKLADIYDTSLYYLNTWEEIWGTLINEKVENVDSRWFGKRFVTTSFGSDVAMFTVSNGYDDPYQDIFLPLLHYVGRSDEGLLKASYLFTYMVFFDEDKLTQELEEQKSAIKALMNNDADYKYLSEIQELYKKTSQVMDYISDFNDSYVNYSQRVSDFEQVRREQKSEFEFIFDWPEFNGTFAKMSDSQRELVDTANASREDNYQKAIDYENQGQYQKALELFLEDPDYKDSDAHIAACEKGVEKSERAKSVNALLPYGITFESSKSEIIEILEKNHVDYGTWEDMVFIRKYVLSNIETMQLEFYFENKNNPETLTSVRNWIYGNTNRLTADYCYDTAYAYLSANCPDAPVSSSSSRGKPIYKDLSKDSVTGAGSSKLVGFSEWMFDAEEYGLEHSVNIVLYEKYYQSALLDDVMIEYTVMPNK